jgi:hypothetical protein
MILGVLKSRRRNHPMLYRSIKPLVVDAVQVKESGEVRTQDGLLHVKAGDWLVRDAQGNLVRCDDINFKCSYESLADAGRIEDLHESKPCGC